MAPGSIVNNRKAEWRQWMTEKAAILQAANEEKSKIQEDNQCFLDSSLPQEVM